MVDGTPVECERANFPDSTFSPREKGNGKSKKPSMAPEEEVRPPPPTRTPVWLKLRRVNSVVTYSYRLYLMTRRIRKMSTVGHIHWELVSDIYV